MTRHVSRLNEAVRGPARSVRTGRATRLWACAGSRRWPV